MNNDINICLSCDDKYSIYAGVVITSILVSAKKDDNLNFYILDGGITDFHKKEIISLNSIRDFNINFVSIDEDLFNDYKNIKTQSYISIATYYRLKISKLLLDVDRIIYLDCDMVVNTSLKELFNINLDNYYIGGVKDIDPINVKENPSYINAGMLVMNLVNIKKDNLEETFLSWTKENVDKITLGDQTIINEVCKGKIKLVDDSWNLQSASFLNRSSYIKNPKIIHFCGKDKPWMLGCQSYHRKYYFRYLQKSPWKITKSFFFKWVFLNQIISLYKFWKHRPFFFLQKKFWRAVFQTYLLN